MKIFSRLPFLLVLAVGIMVLGCKKSKDDEVDPEQETIDKLSFTWQSSAVTLDGDDRTADFTGFTLTITNGKQYQAANVDALYQSVWPSSGTWDFKDSGSAIPDLTTVIRDGSLEISIDLLTETEMILSFTFVTGGLEGTTSTEGNYIFSFTR